MSLQTVEKSQRINLGAGQVHPPGSTARRLTYVASGLFMLAAVFNIIDYFVERTYLGRHIFTSTMYFLAGISFLFSGRIEMSSTSKYAPHFIISESGLRIKTGVFSKSQFFKWDDIRQIELSSNKIGIKMNEIKGLIYYPYATQKETSIDKIKTAIEALAAPKGIEVKKIS
jgi:hypothetical protein